MKRKAKKMTAKWYGFVGWPFKEIPLGLTPVFCGGKRVGWSGGGPMALEESVPTKAGKQWPELGPQAK